MKRYYFDEDLGCFKEIPPQYYQHNLTDKELIKTFFSSSQEAKELFLEKIKEWQEVERNIFKEIKPILLKIREVKDDFSRWFWREVLKVLVSDRLAEAVNHIQRLKRLILIAEDKPKNKINNLIQDLETAKNTPILNVADSFLRLRKTGKAYSALCPFHTEKHPSFYIYPETNSFYCFGCKKGGDVIRFVELALGYSFKEAVNYLKGGR
ncbi:MAG: CHC2 zinc finger domain-containing protein [Candidatus Omnitrophica bacterium]|nr:CHC2 zinc finger domain-containing protein [Candidatus Omnitrophota bacterium]